MTFFSHSNADYSAVESPPKTRPGLIRRTSLQSHASLRTGVKRMSSVLFKRAASFGGIGWQSREESADSTSLVAHLSDSNTKSKPSVFDLPFPRPPPFFYAKPVGEFSAGRVQESSLSSPSSAYFSFLNEDPFKTGSGHTSQLDPTMSNLSIATLPPLTPDVTPSSFASSPPASPAASSSFSDYSFYSANGSLQADNSLPPPPRRFNPSSHRNPEDTSSSAFSTSSSIDPKMWSEISITAHMLRSEKSYSFSIEGLGPLPPPIPAMEFNENSSIHEVSMLFRDEDYIVESATLDEPSIPSSPVLFNTDQDSVYSIDALEWLSSSNGATRPGSSAGLSSSISMPSLGNWPIPPDRRSFVIETQSTGGPASTDAAAQP